jgi:hypothetical protein
MRSFDPQALLEVWELGRQQHPVDRALTMLAPVCPELSRDELASLSIGQRDARLFAVREYIFGPRLASLADCASCGEQLEFALDLAELPQPHDDSATSAVRQLASQGYTLRFRLPDSFDLAALAGCDDLDTARRSLAERCTIEVRQSEGTAPMQALPEALIGALAEALAEAEPQADIELDLTCPACGHRWQTLFDIESFLWAEICTEATRLLYEVHLLARAYGWREADILALSAARRRRYLEMVS